MRLQHTLLLCTCACSGPAVTTAVPEAPPVVASAALAVEPSSTPMDDTSHPMAAAELDAMGMPTLRKKLPVDSGAFYLPTSDPLHPRVRYVDGQESLNDSCIVLTGNKLNRRVPPAFVNGRPLGFC